MVDNRLDLRARRTRLELQDSSVNTIRVIATDNDGPVDVDGLVLTVTPHRASPFTATKSSPELGTAVFEISGEQSSAVATAGSATWVLRDDNAEVDWIVGPVRSTHRGQVDDADTILEVTLGRSDLLVSLAAAVGEPAEATAAAFGLSRIVEAPAVIEGDDSNWLAAEPVVITWDAPGKLSFNYVRAVDGPALRPKVELPENTNSGALLLYKDIRDGEWAAGAIYKPTTVVVPATRAFLDIFAVLGGLSFPLTESSTVEFDLNGATATATLDDTWGDLNAFLGDFVGQVTAAAATAGFEIGPWPPESPSTGAIFKTVAGAATVSVTSADNGDPFGFLTMGPDNDGVGVPGEAESSEAGIEGVNGTQLGIGQGSEHTSPDAESIMGRNVLLIDGPDHWESIVWPSRAELTHAGYIRADGPLGNPVNLAVMADLLERYVAPSARTIRGTVSQKFAQSDGTDRVVVFDTADHGSGEQPGVYTLVAAKRTMVTAIRPAFDLSAETATIDGSFVGGEDEITLLPGERVTWYEDDNGLRHITEDSRACEKTLVADGVPDSWTRVLSCDTDTAGGDITVDMSTVVQVGRSLPVFNTGVTNSVTLLATISGILDPTIEPNTGKTIYVGAEGLRFFG